MSNKNGETGFKKKQKKANNDKIREYVNDEEMK